MHWFLSYSRREGLDSLAALEAALGDCGFEIPSKRKDGKHTVFKDITLETGAYWRLELLE